MVFYNPKNKKCYLKEPKSTGELEKIYGYLMKECKNTQDIKKFGSKEVFELPNIPYIFSLYFLIFLGFNIFRYLFLCMRSQPLTGTLHRWDLLYSSEWPSDNRVGCRISQISKNIFKFNIYYFREPNAYD